ncbi:MAG: hypothetical protein RMK29_04125 [Myxococcales bacterium]|nr:hypothetical protein [Myxococcota bacterium]MDW8280874.1 hypothetical protein [Myxococcales bacterium]
MRASIAVLLVVLGAGSPAGAEPEGLAEGVTVDWSAGMMEAVGSCAADLRAPSVEIARIKAERVARQRAQERLRAALRALPRGRWAGPPPATEALEQALGQAEVTKVHYGSNGSVSVRLRLAIAALPVRLLSPSRRRTQEGGR